jgi:hypothetical protein
MLAASMVQDINRTDRAGAQSEGTSRGAAAVLVERMQKLGFAPGDDLYDAAIRAQAAVHELHVNCHYAGCKHGVGKVAESGWPEHIVKRA